MNKKEIWMSLKPFNWLTAAILTLLGIFNTRMGIGMGRVTMNMFIGIPTYFSIAISGMLIALWLKSLDEADVSKSKDNRNILIISSIFYTISLGVAIFHSVVYGVGVFNLILIILIGITWFFVIFYEKKMKNRSFLIILINGFTFSFGFYYGAALNTWFVPFYIYLFLIASFSLQLSKDVIRSFKVRKNQENEKPNALIELFGPIKTRRIALIVQILSIICIIIPIFLNIYNSTLYLIPMLIVVLFIGIAFILTLILKLDEKYNPVIMILLRTGVFVTFILFLLASV